MNCPDFLFTSESVTEGHPDKMADQISDAVLDNLIEQDARCRVACETLIKTGMIILSGEITTTGYCDFAGVARKVVRDIGYRNSSMGFDWRTCSVIPSISQQSPDIDRGVSSGKGLYREQGAGDQGMMFGYATDETEEFMPLPISLANGITRRLSQVRHEKILDSLLPDGKSQVTVRYNNNRPECVDTVVVSAQHSADASYRDLRESIIEEVIKPVIPENLRKKGITYHVNPTGRFVIGGPDADCGLTGRKIIVDTYGGWSRHGGGCFSGKDPSKVDRSAAYAARHIAKNIVASGLAHKAEIQLAYVIGFSEPVSLTVNTYGTGRIEDEKLPGIIRRLFPLKPSEITEYFDLMRPIYRATSVGGHFGRSEPSFTWEILDKKEALMENAGVR